MKNKKLSVGQILYDYDLKEYKISKVGRKNFEVEGYRSNDRGRFEIESLKYIVPNYMQWNIQLYESKEAVEEIKERGMLADKFRRYLNQHGTGHLKIDALRQIVTLLES